MNKLHLNTAKAVSVLFAIIFIHSCGEDTLNAPQDFASGNITYIDNQFNFSGGYYAVSIYGDSSSPFNHKPIRSDSVAVDTAGLKAYYKVSGLATGNYYIGSTWINRSTGNVTILGSLGCGENPLCPNPTKITIPNYAGTGGLDFKSKTH